MMGPEIWAPYCWRSKFVGVRPRKSTPVVVWPNIWSARPYIHTRPLSLFVPDLVTALTTPPVKLPSSTSTAFVTTWISLTVSTEYENGARSPPRASPPKKLSLLFVPSIMMFDPPSRPPPIDWPPPEPALPTSDMPGVSLTRSLKLRPLSGRSLICCAPMRVFDPVLLVSMSGAISAVTRTVESWVAASVSSKSSFST